MKRTLRLYLIALAACTSGFAHSQAFMIDQPEVEVAVTPSFSPAPLGIPFTASPGFIRVRVTEIP